MPRNVQDTFILSMPTDTEAGRIPPKIIIDRDNIPDRVGSGDEIIIPFKYTIGYPKADPTVPFEVTYTTDPSDQEPTNSTFTPRTPQHEVPGGGTAGPSDELDGTLEAVAPTGGGGSDGVLRIEGIISIPGAQDYFIIRIEEVNGTLTVTPEYEQQTVVPGEDFEMPFSYTAGEPPVDHNTDFEVSYTSTPANYTCTNNRFEPKRPQTENELPETELGGTLSATAPELRDGETSPIVTITGTISMVQPEA